LHLSAVKKRINIIVFSFHLPLLPLMPIPAHCSLSARPYIPLTFFFDAAASTGEQTMKEKHAELPGTDRGKGERCEQKQNGGPHETSCDNTVSGKTATTTSARKEINPSDPVPLYLVPQVIGAVVRRFGRQVEEMHVVQAAGNRYAVTVVTREEAV